MAIGTDYNVKQDLIAAVVAKVFKNDTFGITGEGLQKALCDMIESLWGDEVGTGTGSPNYVDLTHAQLNVLIAGSLLAPGTWYRFTYENVHAITDTLLTNTTAPGYTQITETFLVLATSINKLSGFALSEENPYDVIEYNPTQASHGTPAVLDNGSIIRRYDILNDNEAYFDFRNHTVARFPLNITSIPSTATTVDRSEMYRDPSDNSIRISVRDDSAQDNYRLVNDIGNIGESIPYYTYNGGSIELFDNTITVSSTAVNSTTPAYYPCFLKSNSDANHTGIKLAKGVTNVLIGSGTQFFGIGNKACENVEIKKGSSGITVIASRNITIGEECSNVVVSRAEEISIGKKSFKVLIFDTLESKIGNHCNEILLVDSNNNEIKQKSNNIIILKSNFNELGIKNTGIFIIRQSNKNVFGNNCGSISLGSTTANDFRAYCRSIDIFSGGYNRFAQGCSVINLVGERDTAFTSDPNQGYYSPYSQMSHNTFGIACENISFHGINGGRGNMFGDECGHLSFGKTTTSTDPTSYVSGPALMNTSFCRGVRNKIFKDFPLNSFSFITPNSVGTTITSKMWYSQILTIKKTPFPISTPFFIEIPENHISLNSNTFSLTFESVPVGDYTPYNRNFSYTTPATGTVTRQTIIDGFIAIMSAAVAQPGAFIQHENGIVIQQFAAGVKIYIKEQSNNLFSRVLTVEGMRQENMNHWQGSDDQSNNVKITYENAGGSDVFGSALSDPNNAAYDPDGTSASQQGHVLFDAPNGHKNKSNGGIKSDGYGIDLYPTGGAYTWTFKGYPLSVLLTSQYNPDVAETTSYEAPTSTIPPGRPAPFDLD